MALHGWRLYGVAGIIFAYIVGILLLSVINIQNPRMVFSRTTSRLGEINRFRRHELNGLTIREPIKWCTQLGFLDKNATPLQPTFATESIFFKREEIAPKYKHIYKRGKRKQKDITSWIKKPFQRRNHELVKDLTALASFPGSGNTWLRYLLQQSTGALTGSIYKDYGLLKSGFPAENVCNRSVLVVKTHEWGPKAWVYFNRAILLVRDPDKAILAEFNRQSGGHIGFASRDRYKRTKGRYWQQFVSNKLNGWENMNLAWARNFTGNLKIVYFDDLVADVEGILREVLSFLNQPINEELLSCAVIRKEGVYRRKKRILQFDPYSPVMHKYIEHKKLNVYASLGRHP